MIRIFHLPSNVDTQPVESNKHTIISLSKYKSRKNEKIPNYPNNWAFRKINAEKH